LDDEENAEQSPENENRDKDDANLVISDCSIKAKMMMNFQK